MNFAPTFKARQRKTLDALCRRMIPAAFAHKETRVDLPQAVEARLAGGSEVLFDKFALLLSLFGSRACAVVLHGSFSRFESLSETRQDEILTAWECSRFAVRRIILQAFRRIILSTYYALPESHPGIGFRGPLYLRDTSVAWEGGLQGETIDAEPVARFADSDLRAIHRAIADAAAAKSSVLPRGVVQGSDVSSDFEISADVCVVGSGAGGAVAAARLAEAGYEVVIVEEGGYWTESDFTEQEFEMVPRLYADKGSRTTDDLGISLLQGRAVGGSTLVNWMIMLRTPEWVLEEWQRSHGTEGMSAAELKPFYEMVEGDVHARRVPADAHAPNNQVILDGASAQGWKASDAKINAKGCIRAGFCGLGCRYGAKQSTYVTYIPRALGAGARLYSDARVDRIEFAERGGRAPVKVVRGEIIDRSSQKPRANFSVRAPIVVLAGGAVGTPAILQRSGLGGGGVGKYLRLHPTTAVIGKFDSEMYGTAGIPQSALSDHFIRANNDYGFWIECPALLPGLASAAIPGFGASHREIMQAFPQLSSLIVLNRDGSELGVSNGDVAAIKDGGTRIRYSMSRSDSVTLAQGIEAAARIHFGAGAREVLTLHSPQLRFTSPNQLDAIARAPRGVNQLGLFSAHVNGTCRIGSDVKTSGCNSDGERHGAAGVYVADGSLFPTAPGVNPQATIMALATVVAQRIMTRHPLTVLTSQSAYSVTAG
jgi:choline dehydrogenase-like flavoprotein